ncbi:MAG TPA: hypothetical protein VGM88_04265 [Kofleriaceae bacterium]
MADDVFGTADPSAPVSRADFERAVRALNLSDLDLRDTLLSLAARVIALTDELTRRVDGVEPLPAPPGTPAAPPRGTVEAATDRALPDTLATIRAADARSATRVTLDLGADKYATPGADVPCAELIPLCGARCCTFTFALSSADLDEGIIRWDYGQPYLIRQRASDGFCVHNDPGSHGCTVHGQRPRVCRSYDCRADPRVWIDYAQRIPAPIEPLTEEQRTMQPGNFDLLERARQRAAAVRRELASINESFADAGPTRGPKP